MSSDSKDVPSIKLSDYGKRLEPHVKCRYLEKIAAIGTDPVFYVDANLDPECLPPIEAIDVFSYLVLSTSYYTLQQFRNFKSLQAYNQMISGFITSVQGKVFGDNVLITGKVRHSQKMNEPPIPVWIITNKQGTVMSAHCLTCQAGLGESCSHVASVLFYVEAWTRINGKLACTQVKCSWLLPTYVNEVTYAPVKDINFKSAKRLKDELEGKIDNITTPVVNNTPKDSPTASRTSSASVPTNEETGAFFAKLNETNVKPAILSLISPYSDQFVLKSHQIPTLSDLYDPANLKLSYPELLKKCSGIDVSLSDDEITLIEEDTRDQAKGAAFFKHRAGRVGASMSHSVAHTNPALPSQSIIKTICYPQLFKVDNPAVRHGCKNESKAINAYSNVMSVSHKDFMVTKCGIFIDREKPWMHATPDFLCSCSCCGEGCGEIKCPYSIENNDFESYAQKGSSCLKKVDGTFYLKRTHNYYYQVQQQINITGRTYCDFVVYALF